MTAPIRNAGAPDIGSNASAKEVVEDPIESIEGLFDMVETEKEVTIMVVVDVDQKTISQQVRIGILSLPDLGLIEEALMITDQVGPRYRTETRTLRDTIPQGDHHGREQDI